MVQQELAEGSWNQQHSVTRLGTKPGTVQLHSHHHSGEMRDRGRAGEGTEVFCSAVVGGGTAGDSV